MFRIASLSVAVGALLFVSGCGEGDGSIDIAKGRASVLAEHGVGHQEGADTEATSSLGPPADIEYIYYNGQRTCSWDFNVQPGNFLGGIYFYFVGIINSNGTTVEAKDGPGAGGDDCVISAPGKGHAWAVVAGSHCTSSNCQSTFSVGFDGDLLRRAYWNGSWHLMNSHANIQAAISRGLAQLLDTGLDGTVYQLSPDQICAYEQTHPYMPPQ
jgi:hypothetical protein